MLFPLSQSTEMAEDDPELEMAGEGMDQILDVQVTIQSEARLMQFRDLLVSTVFLISYLIIPLVHLPQVKVRYTVGHLFIKPTPYFLNTLTSGTEYLQIGSNAWNCDFGFHTFISSHDVAFGMQDVRRYRSSPGSRRFHRIYLTESLFIGTHCWR